MENSSNQAIVEGQASNTRTWSTERTLKADMEAKTSQLLQKFEGLKSLNSMQKLPIVSHQSASVSPGDFRDFLKKIYSSERICPMWRLEVLRQIPRFSIKELDIAVSGLKNGRCADDYNCVAEMFKYSPLELRNVLLQTFNDILETGILDEGWRTAILRMLPKAGDLNLPENWRPVAILPIAYKIFSKMLYNRLLPILDSRQGFEQHGFRLGSLIEDAFATVEGLVGRAQEFGLNVWVASLDMRKAFDRIEFDSMFEALVRDGVDDPHLHLLALLHVDQNASVNGSDLFAIQRGVKQGDVISPIIFNAALGLAFSRWKTRLNKHGWLLNYYNNGRLTNSRYLDDILLYAKTLEELIEMMELLFEELAAVGLDANAKKIKILTIDDLFVVGCLVKVFGEDVEVIRADKDYKYFGRKLNLGGKCRAEFEMVNRQQSVWAAFHKYRKVFKSE